MESRVASDEDLKLADTLRYYMRDSQAARSLLVRRLKCLAAYEAANRTLEKARQKNKDIHAVSHACEDILPINVASFLCLTNSAGGCFCLIDAHIV